MAWARRRFEAGFKAKVAVAVEALRAVKSISEIAMQFKVHPNQVTIWKKQLLAEACRIFESGDGKRVKSDEPEASELYEQIGRLKVELEWLKKKWPRAREERRRWIDIDQPDLSVRRQCALLGISRSQLYYEPVAETAENLHLMRLIDEQYLKTPFWGSSNKTAFLRRQGCAVNRNRIQRLLGNMGLEGISPGPSTSRPALGHAVYPYLLKHVVIERPNQVWSSDITYVPLGRGFLYLVAVMDWYSRLVLSWRLSNSLDVEFCVEALDEALAHGRPEIINTDQGSQFTSREIRGEASVGVDRDQHRRPRAGAGQRVHRAVVAEREIRGHRPQGVRHRSRLSEGAAFVFSVLLPRTTSSRSGRPHARALQLYRRVCRGSGRQTNSSQTYGSPRRLGKPYD